MSELKFYNTLGREKQVFNPINPKLVRMYVCGPTVYNDPHIGNARPAIVFDILYRVLCKKYSKGFVLYVRNITDVDDKIINESKKRNISVKVLTDEITKIYHDNLRDLNVLPPNIEPKVTESIDEIISMITFLIEKGYAYEKDGHVFFDVSKNDEYGQLSNQKIDALFKGVRVEVSKEKKDALDFVLWKPDEENGWDSPWGKGRPGWHIECSAMSLKYLGETFDIHGGGIDLVFPHHENEIAQSTCVSHKPMANFWIHNNLINLNNEKMSKSLGNVLTINSTLEKWDGNVIRLAMISSHHRSEINWNEPLLVETQEKLKKWSDAVREVSEPVDPDECFFEFLYDDLNTPKALAYLSKLVNKVNSGDSLSAQKLLGGALYLGIDLKRFYEKINNSSMSDEKIKEYIELRLKYRNEKNFAESDKIRDNLKSQGVILNDGEAGTTWRRS